MMQENTSKQTETGIIPEEWDLVKVGDFVEIKHGYAFKGIFFTLEKNENVVLSPGNFHIGGGFKGDKFKYTIEKYPEDYVLKEDSIIVTMTDLSKKGDTLGYAAKIPKSNNKKYLHNQRLGLLQFKSNKIYPDFLYWVLRTKKYNWFVVGSASGSTVKHTSPSRIKQYQFACPSDLSEQKAIANILSSLDDKIALNHQINQILESMAQAIFKSWFVDFEPVKAKIAALGAGEDAEGVTCAAMHAISGKTDDELDQLQAGQPENYAQLKTTAELFPSAMQDSELGEVPEGWEISTIGEEVGVVGGGTPSTKNPKFWEDGEIHWTTPKDLSNLSDKVLLTTDRKITDVGLKKISSGLLPINTVLMSSRAPVGYLALAKVPVAVNQGYIAMLCDKSLSPEFVIQWCNYAMDEIKQRSSGTTFAEISKKNFKVIQIVVPSEDIQQSYSEMVSGFYDKIAKTAMECKSLADIRDSLLPKLLSGEVIPQGCV